MAILSYRAPLPINSFMKILVINQGLPAPICFLLVLLNGGKGVKQILHLGADLGVGYLFAHKRYTLFDSKAHMTLLSLAFQRLLLNSILQLVLSQRGISLKIKHAWLLDNSFVVFWTRPLIIWWEQWWRTRQSLYHDARILLSLLPLAISSLHNPNCGSTLLIR